MAIVDSREVGLAIQAKVDGQSDVSALVSEVEALAREGGEVAPKFAALAAELRELAGQSSAVGQIMALRGETEKLGRQLEEADARAAGLRNTLGYVTEETAQAAQANSAAAAKLAEARTHHQALKQAVSETGKELRSLKAEAKSSGDAAGDYAAKIDAAKAKLEQYKADAATAGDSVRQLASEHKAAAATLREAEKAEKELSGEYEKTVTSAQKLTAEIGEKNRALTTAREMLQAAGVDTARLGEEQKRLGASLAVVVERIDAERAAVANANPALKMLGTSAEQANAALARIGIRSDAQIKAEIERIDQDLIRLAADARVSGAEFDRTWSAGQAQIARLRAELGQVPPHIDAIGRSANGAFGSIKNLVAGFVGIQTSAKFIEANVELEKMRRGIVAVSGSSEEAAATMNFLRSAAGRLGVDVGGLAGAYVSLAAATRGTSLAGAETQRIFASVTNAMASLGKGGAETERALQAVAQMSSKGVVSMEELRGQLGEALPGALQAAARELGMTDKQLIKLVESGQLLSEEFLPVLRKGLDETFTSGGQKVQGFAAEWQRLKTTLSDTATFVGDSGVMTAITTVAEQGGIAVRGLTGAFELLGKIVGITFGAIASFDLQHPIDSMRNWKAAVTEAADEIQAKMDKAKASAEGSAEAQAKAGNAAAGAAGSMADAAGGIKSNADAHTGVSKAADDSAKAQVAAGDAAKKSAGDMADASAASIKLKAAYKEVLDALAEQTKNTEKLAEANRVASDSTAQLAAMSGNEVQARAAAVAAAQSQIEWSEKVSEAKTNEASVIGAEIAAIRDLASARGGLTKAQSEEVDLLKISMAAKEADAERARAAAEAAKLQETQARLNAEAAKDNAGRLVELRDAAAAAAVEVLRLREAQAQGKATQDEVSKAARDAAIAQGLYRDALNDQAAAIQANLGVKQAQSNLDQTNVQLAIAVAERTYEVAKAKGDEKEATEALLRIKRLEADLAELQAKALQAQAEAELLAIKNKREQAQASGTLTEQLKAELKAEQLSAEAKVLQGKISEETAAKIRQLASEAERAGTGVAGSMQGAAAATQRVGEAAQQASKFFWEMSEAAKAAETDARRLARWDSELQNARANASPDAAGGDGFKEALRRGLVTPDMEAAFRDAFDAALTKSLGNIRAGSSFQYSIAANAAFENALLDAAKAAKSQSDKESTGGATHTTRYEVRIRLGSLDQTVEVGSQNDAQVLTDIFRQLETAAMRAS